MNGACLEIIPLGGLGEFGMNLMLYRDGRDVLIVDAGMMFPSDEHFGIDLLVPDLSFLEDCGTLHGVIVTHGHEDHIGALPYLLARHDIPVYASPLARALIRARLAGHPAAKEARLELLPADGEVLRLGPFAVSTVPATHTIPQSKMIAIETRHGVVVHTADFKLDATGSGEPPTDQAALERLGRRGVLLLCCDATNADRPGATPGEQQATAGLGRTMDETPGRLLVTTFASNVRRVEALATLAGRRGRRVALVGSSLQNHVEHAERLGVVRFAPGARVSAEQAMNLAPGKVVLVVTGTQGEPASALARIAAGTHRDIAIAAGDRVVHSARVIPGNEKRVGRLIDRLLERGAEVTTAADAPVHVSGHASRDDLVRVLDLLRPRYLLPIHGEYRQLWALARLAAQQGFDPERVVLARSGDRIGVSASEIVRLDRVPSGRVFIDARREPMAPALLLERRRSAEGGIVVAIVALGGAERRLAGTPQVLTRGFVAGRGEGPNGILREARVLIARSVRDAGPEELRDDERLGKRVQSDLRRFLRRRVEHQPLIIPVIIDS